MRPAAKAWLGVGAGITAYEILCPPGETLSEGVDAALEHPYFRYAAIAGIAITALHLCNVLPESVDPFKKALAWKA